MQATIAGPRAGRGAPATPYSARAVGVNGRRGAWLDPGPRRARRLGRRPPPAPTPPHRRGDWRGERARRVARPAIGRFSTEGTVPGPGPKPAPPGRRACARACSTCRSWASRRLHLLARRRLPRPLTRPYPPPRRGTAGALRPAEWFRARRPVCHRRAATRRCASASTGELVHALHQHRAGGGGGRGVQPRGRRGHQRV
ncbi:MAG: hypothetical protein WKG07_15160 [Hymenobacter sp.]